MTAITAAPAASVPAPAPASAAPVPPLRPERRQWLTGVKTWTKDFSFDATAPPSVQSRKLAWFKNWG
jgi:hypothetical protein